MFGGHNGPDPTPRVGHRWEADPLGKDALLERKSLETVSAKKNAPAKAGIEKAPAKRKRA